MEWWKDLSKESISGVIVALVTGGGGVAVIVWLWTYIKQLFHWLINVLVHPITMPLWAIIIVSILLLIIKPILGYAIRKRNVSASSEQTDSFLDYTNDTIFEIRTSWRWVKGRGVHSYSFDSLVMRCPVCSGMLDANPNVDLYNLNPYPLIRCKFHGCEWKIAHAFERISYGEMRVKLTQEIDRRCFQRYGS